MGKVLLILLVLFVCGVALAKNDKQLAFGLRTVQPKDLDVTSGDIMRKDDRLLVDSRMMRAVLKQRTDQKIKATFTYNGASKSVSRLQNGDIRHQFGFKMAAKNECNLVYVMWDFDTQRIRISVKSNPGMFTFNDCRDGGYIGLPSVPAPKVEAGQSHTLSAVLNGTDLVVYADDQKIQASLPDVATSLSGPLGLRSDNVNVVFDLTVGGN